MQRTIEKMSAKEKRKLATTDEMQKHINGLVASGAIVLERGKRLKIGDDGLPQVTDLAQDSGLTHYSSARERLVNIVNYLESSASPKSVGWCKALVKLRKLLDNNLEPRYHLDIRAWEICQAANDEAIDDITYMDMLYHRLQDGSFEAEWSANHYNIFQFPQRACRLLGVVSPSDFVQAAWDDGLDNQMFEKDPEAHKLIDKGFGHLIEGRSSAFGENEVDHKAAKYVSLFQKLEPVKALEAVMEIEEFVILECKAKTAKGIQDRRTQALWNKAISD